jgi:hypothetical protein
MKKLNLNDIIKVKLTDCGKDIFYHQHDELNKFIMERGGKPLKPWFPEIDADGYSEFQLWHFMNIYGRHMNNGAPAVVEHMSIHINEEDLEDL